MSANTMLSKRPEKMFLCDQIVRQPNGILRAAIIADLYYWIAKGERPWRKAEDYATLFKLKDVKTIRGYLRDLSQNDRYLNRCRTRKRDGKLGAYSYSKNNTKNSKALFEIYGAILNNSNIKNDFGEFKPDDFEYKEIPQIQLLLSSTIDLTGSYKLAYVYDRLHWAIEARCQESLFFSSYKHIGKWASLNYKSSKRYVEKLQDLNLLTVREIESQIVITPFKNNSTSDFFESYMHKKHENRKTGIAERAA